MAKKDSIQLIRVSMRKLLRYMGGTSRKGEDLSSWRSPGRLDFLVQSLVTEAGGKSTLSEDAVKAKVLKVGYTWDNEIKEMLSERLRPYGITIAGEGYEAPDYSTPTREELLTSSRKAKVLGTIPGKRW